MLELLRMGDQGPGKALSAQGRARMPPREGTWRFGLGWLPACVRFEGTREGGSWTHAAPRTIFIVTEINYIKPFTFSFLVSQWNCLITVGRKVCVPMLSMFFFLVYFAQACSLLAIMESVTTPPPSDFDVSFENSTQPLNGSCRDKPGSATMRYLHANVQQTLSSKAEETSDTNSTRRDCQMSICSYHEKLCGNSPSLPAARSEMFYRSRVSQPSSAYTNGRDKPRNSFSSTFCFL